jgi:hypothetical protein
MFGRAFLAAAVVTLAGCSTAQSDTAQGAEETTAQVRQASSKTLPAYVVGSRLGGAMGFASSEITCVACYSDSGVLGSNCL